jgi:hypothetical protein
MTHSDGKIFERKKAAACIKKRREDVEKKRRRLSGGRQTRQREKIDHIDKPTSVIMLKIMDD